MIHLTPRLFEFKEDVVIRVMGSLEDNRDGHPFPFAGQA